jgi:hypothetical protein
MTRATDSPCGSFTVPCDVVRATQLCPRLPGRCTYKTNGYVTVIPCGPCAAQGRQGAWGGLARAWRQGRSSCAATRGRWGRQGTPTWAVTAPADVGRGDMTSEEYREQRLVCSGGPCVVRYPGCGCVGGLLQLAKGGASLLQRTHRQPGAPSLPTFPSTQTPHAKTSRTARVG